MNVKGVNTLDSGPTREWSFWRIRTVTGSVYTVGLYRDRFAVLRGYSAELSRAVESVDTRPSLDDGTTLVDAPATHWRGRRLRVGSVQTGVVVDTEPESDAHLISTILASYGVDTHEPSPPGSKSAVRKSVAPSAWFVSLPAGIREVFEQIDKHGAITEIEAAKMLGGQRALRRFAKSFDEHAVHAPYAIRIQVVGGAKRYAREEDES